MKTLLLLFLTMIAVSSNASPICDTFRTPGQQQKLRNCEEIVRRKLVPNQNALRYTIKYLTENQGSLRDPSCAVRGIEANDRCIACRNEDWVKSGIENGCSFIINDLNRPWKKDRAPGRTTAYYVDLCTEDPAKMVTPFYVNGGRGPRFSDAPDTSTATDGWNKSTLAGAFKIEGTVYGDFVPTRETKYAAIRRRNGGKIPALRMIGLNSSNNTTESSKPMHVSPFRTSWGCPGVAESTAEVFEKIASKGSSLMIAYAGQQYEQKSDSCVNDSSDAGHAPTGATSGGTTSSTGESNR